MVLKIIIIFWWSTPENHYHIFFGQHSYCMYCLTGIGGLGIIHFQIRHGSENHYNILRKHSWKSLSYFFNAVLLLSNRNQGIRVHPLRSGGLKTSQKYKWTIPSGKLVWQRDAENNECTVNSMGQFALNKQRRTDRQTDIRTQATYDPHGRVFLTQEAWSGLRHTCGHSPVMDR